MLSKCILILQGLIATLLAATALASESTNQYGITMVSIPAGSFQMGSCVEEENKQAAFVGQSTCRVDSDASKNEGPPRQVSVAAFQMGKTPVTLGQFKRFIADAGRTDLITDEFMKYNTFGDNAFGDNAYVTYVSWHDAQAFVGWLNQTDGGGWRLPSEAEWEYACRAGGNHTYCGSNSMDNVEWSWDSSAERPRAVGGKHANAFGLHDMSGDVWEWVQDCWHGSYSGAPTDGSAWTTGCDSDARILRGGYWIINARIARAESRLDTHSSRGYNIGFRLAKSR